MMLLTRYDENFPPNSDLPFLLYTSMTRTPDYCINCANEANWHEDVELQFFSEGAGYVLLDNEKHPVVAGDVVVVNNQTVHYTATDTLLKYSAIIINRQFCREAGLDTDTLRFAEQFQSATLTAMFDRLVTAFADREDICRAAKIRIITLQMLIELRQHHTVAISAAKKNPSFERIKQAITYIRQNYARKISLDSVAKHVLMDKYSFAKEFKRVTKQTVVQHITAYRCKMAIELMQGGATVSEAALQCGFNNMSFFTRTFKLYTGVLPSTYTTADK